MLFNNLFENSKFYFPNLKMKFKDESILMKIISKILFFNKSFSTNYITTIGNTVYFPNRKFIQQMEVSSSIILLHELVHMNDAKRINKYIFSFLYLFPQILFLLFIPFLFIDWKIALFFLVFLLPIPAFFRMLFEKRAYLASLYVINKLSIKMNFKPFLNSQEDFFISNFQNSSYYYMWPFKGLKSDFDKGLDKIKSNKYPFEDKIFKIIDDLIEKSM